MMIVTKDTTDVTSYFHLRLAADGTDATGLTVTNIDMQYCRSGATPAAKVDASALGAANSCRSVGGPLPGSQRHVVNVPFSIE